MDILRGLTLTESKILIKFKLL